MLEPAGGLGDKVFPPSHSVGDNEKHADAKYAFETRRGGKDILWCAHRFGAVPGEPDGGRAASTWVEKKLTLLGTGAIFPAWSPVVVQSP